MAHEDTPNGNNDDYGFINQYWNYAQYKDNKQKFIAIGIPPLEQQCLHSIIFPGWNSIYLYTGTNKGYPAALSKQLEVRTPLTLNQCVTALEWLVDEKYITLTDDIHNKKNRRKELTYSVNYVKINKEYEATWNTLFEI